jgi:hypothetical protein
MKNAKIIKSLLVVAGCMLAASLYSLSEGPISLSGSPDSGGDCSGCHHGALTNSDSKGKLEIFVDSADGIYIPGRTYQVRVRVSYPGRKRFGFLLTTRQGNAAFRQTGNFVTSPISDVLNRIEHVSHKRIGTYSDNSKEWRFNWVVPDTTRGDIDFYAAGIAANADSTADGDLVYASKITLKQHGTTGLPNWNHSVPNVQVYPNPANHLLYVSNLSQDELKEVVLYRQSGEEAYRFDTNSIDVNSGKTLLTLPDELPSGIYLLSIRQGDSLSIQKICIERG